MRGKQISQGENLAHLLCEWQVSGDCDKFANLWAHAASLVRQSVRITLARAHIRDPASADDAVSLVMEHLRRLPSGEVTQYDHERDATNYLRWLAAMRAGDVIRRRRRQSRRERSWPEQWGFAPSVNEPEDASQAGWAAETILALKNAIAELDERSQDVLMSHFEGERQADTARRLGVCPGTVTRIRQRAVEKLRVALEKEGQGWRPPQPR
jgi:RNA polymerase sigma factor (sigma-70 family)